MKSESHAASRVLDNNVVCAPGDVRAASRLRYDVYIAEQGKAYPDAVHEEGTLSDELDESADIILVRDETGMPVGTVRCNSLDCVHTARTYDETFQIGYFTSHVNRQHMVVCSRLAVHPEHRHRMVRDELFNSIYAHRLSKGTILCFATCARVLLKLFRYYGFREYLPPIQDPYAGILHRTVLVLDDIAHLESTGSPFFSIARAKSLASKSHLYIAPIISELQGT